MFSLLSQLHTSWNRSQEQAAPVRPIMGKLGSTCEQVIGYRFNDKNSTGFEDCRELM